MNSAEGAEGLCKFSFAYESFTLKNDASRLKAEKILLSSKNMRRTF